jgi:hypothetical protein
MLNNIIVPVYCYLYQVDPVNLRPKNFTFFVFSFFRVFACPAIVFKRRRMIIFSAFDLK